MRLLHVLLILLSFCEISWTWCLYLWLADWARLCHRVQLDDLGGSNGISALRLTFVCKDS